MDKKRQVYLIAHRINNPKYIKIALESGVNGIECDVRYNKKNNKVIINHSSDKEYFLENWLKILANNLFTIENNIKVIIFDCKFANIQNSNEILNILKTEVENKINDNFENIKVIFSVADFSNYIAFKTIKENLRNNQYISIDAYKDPKKIEEYYKENNIDNGCYGYGVFPFGPLFILESIKDAVLLRDKNKILKSVYVWTLFNRAKIINYLERDNVDGVIINIPKTFRIPFCNIKKLIKEINKSKNIKI